METGFAVSKMGNLWKLKMRGTDTAGTFGSLRAAMQCAYLLTDAAIGETNCDAAAPGCSEDQFGG